MCYELQTKNTQKSWNGDTYAKIHNQSNFKPLMSLDKKFSSVGWCPNIEHRKEYKEKQAKQNNYAVHSKKINIINISCCSLYFTISIYISTYLKNKLSFFICYYFQYMQSITNTFTRCKIKNKSKIMN